VEAVKLGRLVLEMRMGLGFPFSFHFLHICGEHKYAKNGNGNGYFFTCAKIPIGRLDANAAETAYSFLTAICDISLYVEDNITLTVRDSELRF